MLELMFAQLKKMGFDPEVAKSQIAGAVGDIRAMKESQDRTEAMVKVMYEALIAEQMLLAIHPKLLPAPIDTDAVLGKLS